MQATKSAGQIFHKRLDAYNPSANAILRSGDKLRVFGLPQQIDDLAVELRGEK